MRTLVLTVVSNQIRQEQDFAQSAPRTICDSIVNGEKQLKSP